MNENLANEIRKTIESVKDMKIQVGGINNYLSILEGMIRADYQKQVDEAYQRGYNKGYADKKLKAYEEKQKVDEEIRHDIGKWKDIVEGIECAYGTCGTCGTRILMAYKYYEYCPHCGTKNEVTT